MPVENFDALAEREQMPGFKGRFLHTDRMTMVRWSIAAGSPLPEHSHPHEQLTTVLDGEFEMVIDGARHRLRPGDVAVIPSNAVHSGRAVSDCRIIDVFQPVREDYR